MSFNPRFPFHTAVATALVLGAVSYIYTRLSTKKIERVDVDKRFTDAVRYGDLVFISGQAGEGGIGIEEQTESALACVDAALLKAGTDKSKIIEATVWLKDIAQDYNGMNTVYDKWIVSGKPPTRACVQAKLADEGYLVEIRVIAVI